MHLTLVLLSILTAFAVISAAKPPTKLSPTARTPTTSIIDATQAAAIAAQLAGLSNCKANVCFAIDGSGSIDSTEFALELDFVRDVAALVTDSQRPRLAAVQYATANSAISSLTRRKQRFLRRLDRVTQAGGASFVTGGLNYCIAELYTRPGEANKIIMVGDGLENIGSSAADRAALFRDSLNGDISVVAAGAADVTNLLAIVGGNSNRLFQVGAMTDVAQLATIIAQLTLDVCGVGSLG